MKKLLLLIVCVLSLTSCKRQFEEKAYGSSKLELRQLVKQTDTSKESHGSFFLIAGSYSSTETQTTSVKVFAKVDGYYRVIEMPIESIRIDIDNRLTKPNVEIWYSSHEKYDSDSDLINSEYEYKTYYINCPEQYLPEKLLPINL